MRKSKINTRSLSFSIRHQDILSATLLELVSMVLSPGTSFSTELLCFYWLGLSPFPVDMAALVELSFVL